jgi:hypothetical protein
MSLLGQPMIFVVSTEMSLQQLQHFRQPGTAENKAFAAKNKLFLVALALFSAVPVRQKKLAENKAIFLVTRV